MNNQKVRIILKAYDNKVLDQAVKEIVNTAKRIGATVKGPVPLPNNIHKFIVNRSPHIDKESREQFALMTHKRLIYVYLTPQTVEAFMKLELPAGVDVEIKLNGGQ